jgi:hypothetical protein
VIEASAVRGASGTTRALRAPPVLLELAEDVDARILRQAQGIAHDGFGVLQ